jgi:copper chaperone
MIRYKVREMTCNHCAETVTKAVKSVDENANVVVDLLSGEVRVSSDIDAGAIASAIKSSGYFVERWNA